MTRPAFTNDAKGRIRDEHGKIVPLVAARALERWHRKGATGIAVMRCASAAKASLRIADQLKDCIKVAEHANAARRSQKHQIKQEAA